MTKPAKESRGSPDKLHVVPAPTGGWLVKENGIPTPIERFDARDDALAYAYRKVGREAVVIHAPDEWLHSLEAGGKIIRFVQPGKAVPTFGSARGLISIAKDFDEPLEDFSEYTP